MAAQNFSLHHVILSTVSLNHFAIGESTHAEFVGKHVAAACQCLLSSRDMLFLPFFLNLFQH
jgi:hypothetical protein